MKLKAKEDSLLTYDSSKNKSLPPNSTPQLQCFAPGKHKWKRYRNLFSGTGNKPQKAC